MTRDDGEPQQEIVLGNKQLLSVFFVVVALLGVAFTIGYIIGRNTGSLNPAASAATPAPTTSQPLPPIETPKRTEPPPSTTSPLPTDTQPAATQPAKPYEKLAPVETQPAATETPAAAPATTGRYLQVAALKKADADHIVQVLIERKFPATLGESPKEGYVRVLVGPFSDMAALADTKQRLRAAGFESIVAK